MHILITGGAGYIGSVLTRRLLHAGYQVTVLDNFRHGVPSLSGLCNHQALRIVRGDARREADLLPLLLVGKVDVIIPLAALVGVAECKKDRVAAETTNLDAILTLCELADRGIHIIYPNTNSGYGTSGEEICTEDSQLRPISLYGQTKCAAERYIRARGNYTVFRLATVFGMSPRMRWDLMVNNFVWRAVTDGAMVLFQPEFRRNFIHVEDVALAFEWAITRHAQDQVYNLGLDDANLTKLDLAKRVESRVPFAYTVAEYAEDPDRRNYFVSNAKINQAGFKTIRTLDRGIAELIKGAQQYV